MKKDLDICKSLETTSLEFKQYISYVTEYNTYFVMQNS